MSLEFRNHHTVLKILFAFIAVVTTLFFYFTAPTISGELKKSEAPSTVVPATVVATDGLGETNFKALFSTKVIREQRSDKGVRTYHSSKWEIWWLENIERLEKERSICSTIISQESTRDFLFGTAHKVFGDWLFFDDHTHGGIWFNVKNGKFSGSTEGSPDVETFCPEGVPCKSLRSTPPITTRDFNPDIFSWFETKHQNGEVVRDYIEPLVGHLRHPMACGPPDEKPWLVDRSYIVPPPATLLKLGKKAHYYDAGASIWCSGAGGGSLCFFTKLWSDNGITFDRIRAWDGGSSVELAENSYPAEWKSKIQFKSSWISTTPKEADSFVPLLIMKEASKQDYVLFKLDIDHGDTENAIVDYMLDPKNDVLEWIDEFVWEQHVNNYVMAQNWGSTMDMSKNIKDSYQYFLKLRNLGVRAHSYV